MKTFILSKEQNRQSNIIYTWDFYSHMYVSIRAAVLHLTDWLCERVILLYLNWSQANVEWTRDVQYPVSQKCVFF